MEKHHRILKSAGTISLATSLSRIFGYVRDAALASVLGASLSMDAFAVAYRLANLFRRLVGEGGMSAAFVPVFVQYREEHSQKELWEFARKFFYTLALVIGVIVAFEIAFAPFIVRLMAPGFLGTPEKFKLTVDLTRLMAPYLIFVSLTAFSMGILNSFGYFAVPALGPIFFNVAVICAALISPYFMAEPVMGIAVGVLIGGVLQFACQIPLSVKQGMRFQFGISFHHEAIRRVGALLGPSVFGIGILQINLLVDSLMASFLREGTVSQIYYADRVMELVLGIFVISLTTVLLPDMAKSAARKDINEVKKTLLFSFRVTSFVAIPATVGLFVLADPIIHVLFERGRFLSIDTERTAVALAYYAFGLYFISASKLIVSAFYALQDSKTPVKVAFVALIANVVLNFILMHPLKQGGIALATSLASALSCVQLLYIFQKRYGAFEWQKFVKGSIKIAIASTVMGIFCPAALHAFHFQTDKPLAWKAAVLFGTIGLGVLIYFGVALLLRMEELDFFKKFRLRKAA